MQGGARNRDRANETQRYRTAAETALEQLDWVIDYLYRIGKADVAAALKRNRNDIAKRAA